MGSTRRRSGRLIGAVTVIALAFPLTACGTDDNGPLPGPATTAPAPAPTEESTPSPSDTAGLGYPAATVYNLEDVCSGTPVPGAVAYSGPGPHQVVFYDLPIQADDGQDGVIVNEPDAWTAGPPYDDQLVGCVAVSAGPVAKTCDYGFIPEPMSMHWGEYTITLYRATTGAKVAVVKIQGSDDSCPTSIAAPTGDNGPAPENSGLTSDQLNQALGAYIN